MTLPDDHNDLLALMRANLESDSEREWRERAETAERWTCLRQHHVSEGRSMMPIDERDRDVYPDDWGVISKRVREDANEKCQWCGVPNGETVLRVDGRGVWATPSERFEIDPTTRDAGAQWHDEDGTPLDDEPPGVEWPCGFEGDSNTRTVRVVLTVAHLDQDPANCATDNLVALCQRCHLNYDRRPEQRARRERVRLERAGQQTLFGGGR